MTVDDLIERLQTIKKFGHGDDVIEAFDPDAEEWLPISCLTYGEGDPVRIYTDDP